jgi:hypothetical protein
MTAADLLAKNGIKPESTAPGCYRTTCPRCSPERRKADVKCLSVLIEAESACWNCFHCGWSGPEKGSGNGADRSELPHHLYRDDDGVVRFRKVRNRKGRQPKCWFEYPTANGGWTKKKKDAKQPEKIDTQILYRRDEIKKAIADGRIICCVEGEKNADDLWHLGIAATTSAHGAHDPKLKQRAKWYRSHSEQLAGADIVVLNDNDAPGYAHAEATCSRSLGVAKRVRRLDLAQHWPDMPTKADVSDWLAFGHTREELEALIASAPDYAPAVQEQAAAPPQAPTNGIDDDAELEKLARMALLDYDRARKEAGKKLGISRLSTLDLMVKGKRAELGLVVEKPTPPLYEHWKVTAADDPVDGAILLRAIKEVIRRYVFMTDDQAVAVALWVIFSWLHHRMTRSPILFVTSAEKESGKTTLLGVLNLLVYRALQSVSISGPALFRSITKWGPTFVLDETDTSFVKNDDLREVVNSGWTRGQGVVRCHPETHEPEVFPAFAPKVVAMKGRKLDDTTLSRSIIITMKRAVPSNPDEHVADFNYLDNETFARLRSQLMRWAADNVEAIAKATPEIPPGFHNRRRANWKSLLAIAEACGGEWKTAAWKAAKAIETVADTFEASISVQLLQAIKAAFEARIEAPRNSDRIKSEDLVDELIKDLTAPWATYNKGKPISQRQVAGLLKGYDIKPKVIRLEDGSTPRGYLLEWFLDAFERHCASEASAQTADLHPGSATSATDLFSKDISRFSSATSQNDVADKKDGKSCDFKDVAHVADGEGGPATNAAWERLRSACEQSDAVAAESRGSDKRGRLGSPLDYHGPVVAVPEQPPDTLDEHGAPVDERQAEPGPGLGEVRHHELAKWCRRWEAEGEDPADLEDALRNTVREEVDAGVDIEREVAAVIAIVRAGRS